MLDRLLSLGIGLGVLEKTGLLWCSITGHDGFIDTDGLRCQPQIAILYRPQFDLPPSQPDLNLTSN
jgi:hypothetical protein